VIAVFGSLLSVPRESAQPGAHEPVMLTEVLEYLDPRAGDTIVDGTIGLAGHATALAERVGSKGTLVGFDWDAAMLERARERMAGAPLKALHLVRDDYRSIPARLAELGVAEADCILLDLGLNSAQIADPGRGLSFLEDGPLDMRMNRHDREPAAALLNRLTAAQIEDALREYGDERWARAIAKQIVERRRSAPLRTTSDLVECVLAAIPPRAREKRIHPATRTFQAIRILTNRELDDLEGAIAAIAQTLAPGGKLVVLAYHSGEDRAVKHAFRNLSERGFQVLTPKPVPPTLEEISSNPRSRSAKLRAIRRDTTPTPEGR
jgi:16S rRNA (cytosine1402-N4)-methyltransferase